MMKFFETFATWTIWFFVIGYALIFGTIYLLEFLVHAGILPL